MLLRKIDVREIRKDKEMENGCNMGMINLL